MTLAAGAQVGWRIREKDDVGAGCVPGLEDRHADLPLPDVVFAGIGQGR